MPEKKRPTDSTEEAGYTPASPLKRTLAWVGVVYMLILLTLTTFYFYTGRMLGNLGPLLTVPGLIGLGAAAVVSHRTTGHPGKGTAVLLALVCWVLALITLPMGIAGLLSNFQMAAVSTTGG